MFESNKKYNTMVLEMGPDPTQAYFWPAVNKGLSWVFFDPIQWDFFDPKGKNWKIGILEKIYKTQRWLSLLRHTALKNNLQRNTIFLYFDFTAKMFS